MEDSPFYICPTVSRAFMGIHRKITKEVVGYFDW
jgi:hypothetical protein